MNQIGNKSEKYYERLSDHGGRAIAITRQSIEDTRREYQAGKIWEADLNCPMQKKLHSIFRNVINGHCCRPDDDHKNGIECDRRTD